MNQPQISQAIGAYFADKPVNRAWLFGSVARGDARPDSDVDILIELDSSQPVGLEYVHWWLDLKDVLQRDVDLVCTGAVSRHVQSYVEQDKVLVYEK